MLLGSFLSILRNVEEQISKGKEIGKPGKGEKKNCCEREIKSYISWEGERTKGFK